MVQRFTVYDVLENKGFFRSNPANVGSQDGTGASLYKGPSQYPRMLFHPKGEERIIQQGEVISTPLGPKTIMQQREMIYKIVNNYPEENRLVKEGWHLHPADALRAAGKDAPETGAAQVIDDLEKKIALLLAQKAALEGIEVKDEPPNPMSL
jgi:hypothetical protein